MPGFGVISTTVSASSNKIVFGNLGMIYAMMSIGVLGFVVWSQWLAFLTGDCKVINFAICWNSLVHAGTFNSENLVCYAQSAGNLSIVFYLICFLAFKAITKENVYHNTNTDKSSSETTRETSFNFEAYRKLSNKSPEQISDDWLAWFIGFSEGDGAFLTGTNKRLSFVLTQKEKEILNHIEETINIGRVKTYGPFSRYHVDDQKGILLLTALFNGNTVLLKRKIQIKKWLNILNFREENYNVIPSLNNAWLSGFIDAEGCFNVTLFKRKAMALGYQVKLRFMIDQKDSLNDMIFIKKILNLHLSHRKLKKGSVGISTMHRVESNSFIRIPLIIEHLNKFKLKTKKQESFHKWVTVYHLVINKAHLTESGLNEIRKLSKQINLITSVTNKTGNK